jgi:hypothetical protein
MPKIRILKFFVFISVLISSDLLIGYGLRVAYFKQKHGHDQALTYSLFKCQAPVMIIGTSTAQHHYDTRILQDSLKMNCYNYGQGSQGILFFYAEIETILKRFSPRIIVIDIFPLFQFGKESKDSYDKLSVLLPYCFTVPELRPIILLRSPYEKIKLLSSIYPYNSRIFNIIRNTFDLRPLKDEGFLGFIPINDRQLVIDIKQKKPEHADQVSLIGRPFDPVIDSALMSIIDLCQVKGVKLVFIQSPAFRQKGQTEINKIIAENHFIKLLNRTRVPYIDFSDHPSFARHPELFRDENHLNEEGAKLFTTLVSDILLKDFLGDDNWHYRPVPSLH